MYGRHDMASSSSCLFFDMVDSNAQDTPFERLGMGWKCYFAFMLCLLGVWGLYFDVYSTSIDISEIRDTLDNEHRVWYSTRGGGGRGICWFGLRLKNRVRLTHCPSLVRASCKRRTRYLDHLRLLIEVRRGEAWISIAHGKQWKTGSASHRSNFVLSPPLFLRLLRGPNPSVRYSCVYIYIIYTPNLGLVIAVLGREREQGHFRGSTGGASREHRGS